jgi:hypothetical protein
MFRTLRAIEEAQQANLAERVSLFMRNEDGVAGAAINRNVADWMALERERVSASNYLAELPRGRYEVSPEGATEPLYAEVLSTMAGVVLVEMEPRGRVHLVPIREFDLCWVPVRRLSLVPQTAS